MRLLLPPNRSTASSMAYVRTMAILSFGFSQTFAARHSTSVLYFASALSSSQGRYARVTIFFS